MSAQPAGAAELPRAFGAYLPLGQPAPTWTRWTVVSRARGWHVSRETNEGTQREFLLNEVHRVRIFRSLPAAVQACARANFDVEVAELATEPLLSPGARS